VRRKNARTLIAAGAVVEMGMTPMQAIVATTKNGPFAADRTQDLGTLEAGQIADMLVLDSSPLWTSGTSAAFEC